MPCFTPSDQPGSVATKAPLPHAGKNWYNIGMLGGCVAAAVVFVARGTQDVHTGLAAICEATCCGGCWLCVDNFALVAACHCMACSLLCNPVP